MKWMMSSVGVLVAAVLSVSVVAQSGGGAANGGKMDKMAMKDATYTGCIEAAGMPSSFTLTHLVTDDHMGKETMKKDTMAKDGMSKDAMAPTTWSLSSSSVDLSKHVGHKVTVTGAPAPSKMDAMGKDTMAKDAMGKDAMAKSAPVFTVTALKMVAASCP